MASTSASSVQKSFKYDVFLSFRGEDTRKTFVDHLYHALVNKGIVTYKDDEKIEKGERISEQLIRSIEESRFYIIVFSKTYASSSWCLEELVKIMECQKMAEHTAYPIFYDVEPTEVRNQSGAFGEAFQRFTRKRKLEEIDLNLYLNVDKHEKEEDVGRWRNAMKEAAGLAGMELKNTFNGHEAKFIQQIVEEVSLKLHLFNRSVVDGKLVGMEARVKHIVSSLETDADDVRTIGIKGIGGGGKTTLARAVFDTISIQFECKSFVENVREVSNGSPFGLKELQIQVLKDVSNEKNIEVTSISGGQCLMKKMMCERKVLLVLDDVDDIEQLGALAGEHTWFKPGSRIIITTRNEQVLKSHQVNFIHQVNLIHDVSLLKDEEAICLLSKYAFGREIPNQGYEELSRLVVKYAAGLPLTIKVLGSFLYGRIESEWSDTIKRLKTIPLNETMKKLEISYESLDNDQKEIFLDIACILKGETKEKAIQILESCEFCAQIGLRVLEQKSLISISIHSRLLLHDHIEEMGRNIVRRLHEPKRHSRLWIKNEIEDILVNESGTEETKCIRLVDTTLPPTIIMEGLRKLKELRFLYVKTNDVSHMVDEVTSYIPDSLQSLYWEKYPFKSLPELFQGNKLANLEMPESKISKLCEGGEKKVLNNLKFLDLSGSRLLRTFDLTVTPQLEELNLGGCYGLVELQFPNECPNLKFLDLSGSKVSNLNLGLTPNLEKLIVGYDRDYYDDDDDDDDDEGYEDFVELQLPVKCPNLKELCIMKSKVSNLNLGLIPNLEKLDLTECRWLEKIHAPVGCLKKLVYLELDDCSGFETFEFVKQYESDDVKITAEYRVDTCPLHPENKLPAFKFECTYDEPGSSWSGNLEKLISSASGLCACKNLESLLATISGLQHLRELKLKGSIPGDQWQFKHLKSLKIWHCDGIEQLHENISRLECLEELHLKDCRSLQGISNSPMKCLKRLYISDCGQIEKLTEELECLEELHLDDCRSLQGISNSPMKCLKRLRLSFCYRIEKLPEEVECLEELYISYCSSLREITNIGKMKCLKRLRLSNCNQVERLSEELVRLECLVKLEITNCRWLPDVLTNICKMKCLEYLTLSYCEEVEKLPEELGRLECLKKLELAWCESLRDIPDSICQMKCLMTLDLSFCHQIEKLPEELGRLECLKELDIHFTRISCLPQSINQLKGLRIIGSEDQLQSYGFTSVTGLSFRKYYVEL